MEHADKNFDYKQGEKDFINTFKFLSEHLNSGIHRNNRNQTPIVLFEAVSAGTALALREEEALVFNKNLEDLIGSEELKQLTTGATNSKPRVYARIDFIKNHLLGNEAN